MANSTPAVIPDKLSFPDIILPADRFHKGQESRKPKFRKICFKRGSPLKRAMSADCQPGDMAETGFPLKKTALFQTLRVLSRQIGVDLTRVQLYGKEGV